MRARSLNIRLTRLLRRSAVPRFCGKRACRPAWRRSCRPCRPPAPGPAYDRLEAGALRVRCAAVPGGAKTFLVSHYFFSVGLVLMAGFRAGALRVAGFFSGGGLGLAGGPPPLRAAAA